MVTDIKPSYSHLKKLPHALVLAALGLSGCATTITVLNCGSGSREAHFTRWTPPGEGFELDGNISFSVDRDLGGELSVDYTSGKVTDLKGNSLRVDYSSEVYTITVPSDSDWVQVDASCK